MEALAIAESRRRVVEVRVAALSNDELIIELLQTVNHLSRWLTPIHERSVLEYSPRRAEPSVKDLLIDMRNTETRVFSLMRAIAVESDPNLDRVPRVEPTVMQIEADRRADPLVVMSEFRRVRQSSTALLRSLPDTAWLRQGYSRTERDWTIRQLAESLGVNDFRMLEEIDATLIRVGARNDIASVSQVRLEDLRDPFLSVASRG